MNCDDANQGERIYDFMKIVFLEDNYLIYITCKFFLAMLNIVQSYKAPLSCAFNITKQNHAIYREVVRNSYHKTCVS